MIKVGSFLILTSRNVCTPCVHCPYITHLWWFISSCLGGHFVVYLYASVPCLPAWCKITKVRSHTAAALHELVVLKHNELSLCVFVKGLFSSCLRIVVFSDDFI